MAKDFFDFADELLDSIKAKVETFSHGSGDPDLDKAWNELDDWMGSQAHRGGFNDDLNEFDRRMAKLGHKPHPDGRDGATSNTKQRTQDYQEQRRASPPPPRETRDAYTTQLAKDYRNLEIDIGADEAMVKSAYKKVLMKYHPDRFASDPEKQATATELTIKLGESYKRIMDWLALRSGKT